MNEVVTPGEFLLKETELPEDVVLEAAQPSVIPIEAYTSPEYSSAENELLWGKVWQAACRVEEVPNVGDYVTYDIVDESIVIVRTAEDRIQAFYNVCQHRGRQLTEGCGNTRQFVCRFHGWRWKINGETAFINDRKGYGGCLTNENTALVPVKIDSWGGWLWINMDPDSEPLREYLEPAPTLLDPYELDKMRYRWRQWLVFPCNWKTALEAFSESHHGTMTHPQLSRWGTADFFWCKAEGKHAWHGPAVSAVPGRPGATNATSHADSGLDPRIATAEHLRAILEGVNACTTATMVAAAERLVDELPEGTPAHEVMAHLTTTARADDAARGVIWPTISPDHPSKAGHDWHIFPNTIVLHSQTNALCYRARPNGSDPNSCIFEVYVIERYPEGEEPKTEWVHVPDPKDDRWPEVLQQDFHNMPRVQQGMKSRGFQGPRPNPRQEVAVYHFHQTLADYMGTGAPRPLAET